MSEMTLHDLSKKMRDIDFVMLQTRTENCEIAGRPMSNNKDVEYDATHHGDFFYIRTNENAKNFRLLRTSAANPSRDTWEEVIPARPGVTIEGVAPRGGIGEAQCPHRPHRARPLAGVAPPRPSGPARRAEPFNFPPPGLRPGPPLFGCGPRVAGLGGCRVLNCVVGRRLAR